MVMPRFSFKRWKSAIHQIAKPRHKKNRFAVHQKLVERVRNSQNGNRENIVIFDWDNKILPTCCLLEKNGLTYTIDDLTEAEQVIFQQIDYQALSVLRSSSVFGKVAIVTNASFHWLERTANAFLPKVARFIFDPENKCPIISARDNYCRQFPEDPGMWKRPVFDSLMDDMKLNGSDSDSDSESVDRQVQIICVGDSDGEHEAAVYALRGEKNPLVKNVKFRSDTSATLIRKQLVSLESQLCGIICFPSSAEIHYLDFVGFTKKSVNERELDQKILRVSMEAVITYRSMDSQSIRISCK